MELVIVLIKEILYRLDTTSDVYMASKNCVIMHMYYWFSISLKIFSMYFNNGSNLISTSNVKVKF